MTFSFSHDHVGISVTPGDLDPAIEWYSSKLDFAVDQRFDANGTTFVFLVNGDIRIELFTGAAHRGQAPPEDVFASLDPARMHHICLAVADLDAAIARLRDRDVRLIGGPLEVPVIGQRIAFITDNLGTVIELTERI